MKRILFTLVFFAIGMISLKAQVTSILRPTLVVWKVDGQKYALRKALYGVPQPQKLTLEVYFRQQDLQRFKNNDIKLEFRWYYYLSTRRKFVKSQVVSLAQAQRTKEGAVIFRSTLYTVQPGWWEVQIVSSVDRRFIQYANLDRFQIFVNRMGYVRR